MAKIEIKEDLLIAARAMNAVLMTLEDVEFDLLEYSEVLDKESTDLLLLMANVEDIREDLLDVSARFEVIAGLKREEIDEY